MLVRRGTSRAAHRSRRAVRIELAVDKLDALGNGGHRNAQGDAGQNSPRHERVEHCHRRSPPRIRNSFGSLYWRLHSQRVGRHNSPERFDQVVERHPDHAIVVAQADLVEQKSCPDRRWKVGDIGASFTVVGKAKVADIALTPQSSCQAWGEREAAESIELGCRVAAQIHFVSPADHSISCVDRQTGWRTRLRNGRKLHHVPAPLDVSVFFDVVMPASPYAPGKPSVGPNLKRLAQAVADVRPGECCRIGREGPQDPRRRSPRTRRGRPP